ncbi:hypothetical protein CJP74_01730 [Psittacicella melopsittaci]|uniref:Outer membrane protein beta-barrel domain-containing protein n=1 Tax=Psittacicella melopsittaci TaxID=2028576 RepID=A0A3A1Y5B9_9GAMM|nr:outer membrane beta-barrel protein [Psittacicella melopsittaci]RIY33472.1 hypothetical protein CJP74_01730 [Psittacicella melopsittaci]
MRKLLLTLSLATLVAGGAYAQGNNTTLESSPELQNTFAQYRSNINFNFALGYGFTKFGNIDHSFTGPVAKLGVDFRVASLGTTHQFYFGPEVAFAYSSKSLDSSKFKGQEAGTNVDTKVTQYTVGVKGTYLISTPDLLVNHYISLGLGMNNVHYSLNTGEGTTQNSHGMYASLEGGVKFKFGLTLGLEYRHAWKTGLKDTAFDDSSNALNLLVGYSF